MSYYLIKRDPEYSGGAIRRIASNRKGYTETVITRNRRQPASNKLKKGDVIFVAEKAGVVYARGVLIEDPSPVVRYDSVEEALRSDRTRKDPLYWMDKLIRFERRKRTSPDYVLRCQEYFLRQELLRWVVPPEGPVAPLFSRGYAHSLCTLSSEQVGYINSARPLVASNLEPDIPSWLRLQLHSLFTKHHSVSHWVDIDHFVPRSAHGPGNIPENLVPIGLSLNRYKSNAIPMALFRIAARDSDIDIRVERRLLALEADFVRPNEYPGSLGLAQAINDIVRTLPVERARTFYGDVLQVHNPAYFEIVEQFSI